MGLEKKIICPLDFQNQNKSNIEETKINYVNMGNCDIRAAYISTPLAELLPFQIDVCRVPFMRAGHGVFKLSGHFTSQSS